MTDSDNTFLTSGQGGQPTMNVTFGDQGQTSAANAAGDLIKDTTTAKFMADVVQESRKQPVLVDFWAPWCGPCKQLTPVLEKVVREAGGKVKLVKLNIDEHPAIPGQMGVQSIPAVFAFVNGQPVDGFMGAMPESQLKAFIDKIVGAGGGKDDEAAQIQAALDQARERLDAGDIQGAAQIYAAIMQHAPDNVAAQAGMAECMIAAGRTQEAEQLLGALDEKARAHPDVAKILARLALEAEVAKLGDPSLLEARIAADPNDFEARLDLAKILSIRGQRNEAADHLLAIMKADRSWRDDGGRRELLALFEAWGPTDPATLAARRKLSSILFS
jgi:putative thioredoxin